MLYWKKKKIAVSPHTFASHGHICLWILRCFTSLFLKTKPCLLRRSSLSSYSTFGAASSLLHLVHFLTSQQHASIYRRWNRGLERDLVDSLSIHCYHYFSFAYSWGARKKRVLLVNLFNYTWVWFYLFLGLVWDSDSESVFVMGFFLGVVKFSVLLPKVTRSTVQVISCIEQLFASSWLWHDIEFCEFEVLSQTVFVVTDRKSVV